MQQIRTKNQAKFKFQCQHERSQRWFDLDCWDNLKRDEMDRRKHMHEIVICWADGCIGIYQLLTATIFIVSNSLLPLNLEENGFMNEYYEHTRV